MLTFLRKVKKLVFSFSYFEATQYFRFRKQQAYVHTSAGVVSFILQVAILTSLIYNIVATVSRSSVMVSNSYFYNYPPTNSILSAKNNFMFAIENINVEISLNVSFYQNDEKMGPINGKKLLGISEPCKMQHWSSIPNIEQDFKNRNISNWICMPINAAAVLQGSKNLNTNKYLSIQIQCPSFISNSSAQLILHFVSPLINPFDGNNYLTHYINNDYTLSILPSPTYERLTLSMEDYSILSDTTILPWYSYKNDKGIIATDSKVNTIITNINSYKAQVFFKKSSKSTTYTRNFLKIMDAFYFIIGSFAPTMIAFAFFIHPILSSIFQMRFATYLYRLQQGRLYGLKEYFIQMFYKNFKNICKLSKQKWQKWSKIVQARETLNKVMQVQYLYERIQFLQNSLKLLFEEHQISGLRMIKKDSINQAVQKHRQYKFKNNIKKLITSQEKKKLKELQKIHKITMKKIKINQQQNQSQKQKLQGKLASYGFFKEQDLYKVTNKDMQLHSKKQISSIKFFQFDDQDYFSDDEYQHLGYHKQSYVKIIQDFKRLKQQAQSSQKRHNISKKIYGELRAYDIQLMGQFARRFSVQKEQNKKQSKIQSQVHNFKISTFEK